MSRDTYMGYAPLVDRYIAGALTEMDRKMLEESAKANAAYVVNSDSWTFNQDMNAAPSGSTLVIPIKGAIMKESFCGDKGTAEVMDLLRMADGADNISKVILDIDSGGGSVDGTFELADYISNTFKKPITGYVNGMACSAAYAIACACDEVIASHASAMVGSIGVAISFTDWSKRYEQMGVVEHYITADGSEDKNKAYMDAKAGDYAAIKEQNLNPTRDIFIAEVKQNRPNINASVFSGKVYLAQDAVKLGLIDKVMQMDEVINAESESNQSNQNLFMFNKFSKLAALKGIKTADLTDQQLADANREMLEYGIEGVVLHKAGEISAVLEEIENPLQVTVDTQNTRIEELTAEVARLGKIVPEGSTTVIKDKTDLDVRGDANSQLSEVDKRLQAQAQAELDNMNL